MAGLPRAIHNTAKKQLCAQGNETERTELKGQTATEVPGKCESRGRPSAVAATPRSSR